jgi:hypothetical protein
MDASDASSRMTRLRRRHITGLKKEEGRWSAHCRDCGIANAVSSSGVFPANVNRKNPTRSCKQSEPEVCVKTGECSTRTGADDARNTVEFRGELSVIEELKSLKFRRG